MPYSYSFRNASLLNKGHFANFAQNWLRNRKERSRSIKFTQIPFILPRDAMLSAVYAVVVCLCVCLCVCHTPVLYQSG